MGRRWKTVHGKTHSWNAQDAESRGEMPITRAVEEVYTKFECKKHRVSRRKVREYLEANCRRGWHHVAGYNGVRDVAYYDTKLTREQHKELFGDRG